MIKKRGQVTLFVIIAILIIGLIVGFFILKNKNSAINVIPVAIKPIYNSLNDCFKKEVYKSIYEIGQFGGYAFQPNNSIDIGIPIYLNDKSKEIPSLDFIELQTSTLIEENIKKCETNFTGFVITKKDSNVFTSILDKTLSVKIEYPLTISKGDSSYQLKNFPEISIPFKLGIMHNISLEIIDLQIENNGSLCLTCLLDFGEENDLSISTLDYDEGITLFSIADNKQINNQTYELVFAIKNE